MCTTTHRTPTKNTTTSRLHYLEHMYLIETGFAVIISKRIDRFELYAKYSLSARRASVAKW